MKSILSVVGAFVPMILVVGLFVVAGYGYIINIITLLGFENFEFTVKTIVGIGGIFVPPIGVIMGLFVW